MKKAKYICFEGTEGTGKSTQLLLIAKALRDQGFKVFETKEPGTDNSPLTIEMRKLALDAKWEKEITVEAREFLLQAIRSVHIDYVVNKALTEHDYIIQDRGQLSGLAYGDGCGVPAEQMDQLINITLKGKKMADMYDLIILLKGDVHKGLERAVTSKQEFPEGDALENKGGSFLSKVDINFDRESAKFNNVKRIDVENKSKEDVSQEILNLIKQLN